MRRERPFNILGPVLASLLLLGLLACGGHARITGTAAPGAPAPSEPVTAPTAAPASGPRNVLRLATPALAGLAPGSEFDVTLSATTIEPLFQASARLLYDAAQLEPVDAVAGQFGAGFVSLARADSALRLDGSAFVPFACTGLPGSAGLPPDQRDLLRVRFRVRQAITGNAGLHLLSDPAYLQLRAPDGRRLSFDLSEEVAAR